VIPRGGRIIPIAQEAEGRDGERARKDEGAKGRDKGTWRKGEGEKAKTVDRGQACPSGTRTGHRLDAHPVPEESDQWTTIMA
jgi:hypothetical protein